MALRHFRREERARMCEMDLYRKDPAVTKAMAVALMRQALDLLDAVNEQVAGCHLQMAIEAIVPNQPPGTARETG